MDGGVAGRLLRLGMVSRPDIMALVSVIKQSNQVVHLIWNSFCVKQSDMKAPASSNML